MTPLRGLHHVTAICGDVQHNVDFYAGLLGLRLVKKTVNFDDPESYHLYYGDRLGSPGTLLTFFAWPEAPRGQAGSGEPVALTFEVPSGSLDWWEKRLRAANVSSGRRRVFGADVLSFSDRDGMQVELVESADNPPTAFWAAGGISEEFAIRAISAVTLSLRDPAVSGALYTVELGFGDQGIDEGTYRFEVGQSGSRGFIDVHQPLANHRARMGAGSIHHVAFRTDDDLSQEAWRKQLTSLGLNVSPVMDRKYFHSIYFREVGGVLFEIATDGPGMTVDESEQELGQHLALPSDYEAFRTQLETSLRPLHAPQLAAGTSPS